MTGPLSDFHAAVTRLLASMPHLPEDSIAALQSSEISKSGPVALRILQHLVTPAHVVVDVDAANGNGVSADRPLRLLELRRDGDIAGLDPEDVFPLTFGGKTDRVNATFEGATVDAHYVYTAFDTAKRHRASCAANRTWAAAVDREDAAGRRFQVEWVKGYGNDVPPTTYPMAWFEPAAHRGFALEDALAVLRLQVGEAQDFTSPTWHVRVTRIS